MQKRKNTREHPIKPDPLQQEQIMCSTDEGLQKKPQFIFTALEGKYNDSKGLMRSKDLKNLVAVIRGKSLCWVDQLVTYNVKHNTSFDFDRFKKDVILRKG